MKFDSVLFQKYFVINGSASLSLSLLPRLQWIGSPCGSHGPYTFYRAFSGLVSGSSGQDKAPRTLTAKLGQFLFVRCQPHEPECIAELQLLWEDRSRQQMLASTRLYFSPEDTPQGRDLHHGQVRGQKGSCFLPVSPVFAGLLN